MQDYVLVIDSACDLPQKIVDEMNVKEIPVSFIINEKKYKNYLDHREMGTHEFYEHLRSGEMSETMQITPIEYIKFFEPFLAEGKDILYLAFSSGLSGTYQSSVLAAAELKEKYKERKILTIDTKCATVGEGLLNFLAAKEMKNGKTIEEVAEFVENLKNHICSLIRIDDLKHLKRGGRLSGAKAFVGTVMGMKPIIFIDEDGKLASLTKARGKTQSLDILADIFSKEYDKTIFEEVFIGHGDALEEAEYLKAKIIEKCSVNPDKFLINAMGPFIGTHGGPSAIMLFFCGKSKNIKL